MYCYQYPDIPKWRTEYAALKYFRLKYSSSDIVVIVSRVIVIVSGMSTHGNIMGKCGVG